MAATTVVIRYLDDSAEAKRILDALDSAMETPGDPLSTGRRYTLTQRTQSDRATAVATLKTELDRISASWPEHVAIHGIA